MSSLKSINEYAFFEEDFVCNEWFKQNKKNINIIGKDKNEEGHIRVIFSGPTVEMPDVSEICFANRFSCMMWLEDNDTITNFACNEINDGFIIRYCGKAKYVPESHVPVPEQHTIFFEDEYDDEPYASPSKEEHYDYSSEDDYESEPDYPDIGSLEQRCDELERLENLKNAYRSCCDSDCEYYCDIHGNDSDTDSDDDSRLGTGYRRF